MALNVVTPDNLNPDQFDLGGVSPNLISLMPSVFTSAGMPAPSAAPSAGASPFYVQTGTTPRRLHYWDGAAWNLLGDGVGVSGTGEANTASSVGTGQSIVNGKVGVDLQFRSLIAGAGVTITDTGGDLTIASTVVGGASDGNISNVQLVGTNLQFSGMNGGFNGSVSLASLAGAPADGTVTAAALSGANILTLTRSVGAPVTVDLSALAGGGGGGVNSVTANAPLVVSGTAAAPVLDINFAMLAPADITALANALCANATFRECVMDIFLEGFTQAGGELQIADGTNGAGVFTFTPCP